MQFNEKSLIFRLPNCTAFTTETEEIVPISPVIRVYDKILFYVDGIMTISVNWFPETEQKDTFV